MKLDFTGLYATGINGKPIEDANGPVTLADAAANLLAVSTETDRIKLKKLSRFIDDLISSKSLELDDSDVDLFTSTITTAQFYIQGALVKGQILKLIDRAQ